MRRAVRRVGVGVCRIGMCGVEGVGLGEVGDRRAVWRGRAARRGERRRRMQAVEVGVSWLIG